MKYLVLALAICFPCNGYGQLSGSFAFPRKIVVDPHGQEWFCIQMCKGDRRDWIIHPYDRTELTSTDRNVRRISSKNLDGHFKLVRTMTDGLSWSD